MRIVMLNIAVVAYAVFAPDADHSSAEAILVVVTYVYALMGDLMEMWK